MLWSTYFDNLSPFFRNSSMQCFVMRLVSSGSLLWIIREKHLLLLCFWNLNGFSVSLWFDTFCLVQLIVDMHCEDLGCVVQLHSKNHSWTIPITQNNCVRIVLSSSPTVPGVHFIWPTYSSRMLQLYIRRCKFAQIALGSIWFTKESIKAAEGVCEIGAS